MNSGVEIDSSEEIAVLDKPYIQKLIHLLKRTPQRTIGKSLIKNNNFYY